MDVLSAEFGRSEEFLSDMCQSEKCLSKECLAFHVRAFAEKDKKLTEAFLEQVNKIVEKEDSEMWKDMPRLRCILYAIDQKELYEVFSQNRITDLWFPFTADYLPSFEMSDETKKAFLKFQPTVLTNFSDVNEETSQHRHFCSGSDVPLAHMKKLGQGASGEVDMVKCGITSEEYARKRILRGATFKDNQKVMQSFQSELENLKTVAHHHIVRFIESYTDNNSIGIVMTPVAEYNLKEFLNVEPLPPERKQVIRTFFGCLASALNYLHSRLIRHKDIKPQNILVKDTEVFLTDFGISVSWAKKGSSMTTGPSPKTPKYCAPEVASQNPRDESSDVWSLGCVFLEIWTVLKGYSLDHLERFLERSGKDSSSAFHLEDKYEASMNWCLMLEAHAECSDDDPPKKWITQMMEREIKSRAKIEKICDDIYRESLDASSGIFSGPCCRKKEKPECSLPSPQDLINAGPNSSRKPKALHSTKQFIDKAKKKVDATVPKVGKALQGAGKGIHDATGKIVRRKSRN